MKAILPIILVVIFPVFTHIAIYFNATHYALFYLALLLILLIIELKINFALKIILSVGVLILIGYECYQDTFTLLYLPPIIISVSLAVTFVRSLFSNKIPLVTQLASRLYQKEMPQEIKQYTRKCTYAWAIITGLIAVETILLAIFAPIAVWSLFCNVLNYIFIGAFFIIEYIYRVYRFGYLMKTSQYVHGLATINWREFMRKQP